MGMAGDSVGCPRRDKPLLCRDLSARSLWSPVEARRGAGGRLGRLGRLGLPPAVTVLPLLAGAATGFCPQGAEGALPAPLPLYRCRLPLGWLPPPSSRSPPRQQRTVPPCTWPLPATSPGQLPTPPTPASWEPPSWCLRLITLGRRPGEAGREGAGPASVQTFPHGFLSGLAVLPDSCSTLGVGMDGLSCLLRSACRSGGASAPLGPSQRLSPL